MNTIGKQQFTSLYSPAREKAFTERNIVVGWSKAGLFPFNPQRVLQDMEKPFAKLTKAAGSRSACASVTPVSAAGFEALQDTIINDAHALDGLDKQRSET